MAACASALEPELAADWLRELQASTRPNETARAQLAEASGAQRLALHRLHVHLDIERAKAPSEPYTFTLCCGGEELTVEFPALKSPPLPASECPKEEDTDPLTNSAVAAPNSPAKAQSAKSSCLLSPPRARCPTEGSDRTRAYTSPLHQPSTPATPLANTTLLVDAITPIQQTAKGADGNCTGQGKRVRLGTKPMFLSPSNAGSRLMSRFLDESSKSE